MKKIRNLAGAVFCGALVIFAMQSWAAAQENPGNLGENKGVGDPRLRVGSWELVRIETTAKGFANSPRQRKDLSIETRERKGIYWAYGNRKISADLVFENLKEMVSSNQVGGDVSFKVPVKAAVTGKGMFSDDPNQDFAAMKCTLDLTSSGQTHNVDANYNGRQYQIYAASLPARVPRFSFSKEGEFVCGGDYVWRNLNQRPEEDFTLNFHLFVSEAAHGPEYEGDVSFHFFYKWKGWDYVSPGPPGDPGDAGVGPLDRDGQYRWAQKQDARTLESLLISNAARLFNSPSVSSEKLSSAFADISVIIADRAAKAHFSADDKEAASSSWSTHKNRAARQDPKVSLDNLRQRLSAAFTYLSRSQQDLFFADVSVAMAKAEVAAPANQVAQDGPANPAAQDGPFVRPSKSVFAPGERIAVDYGSSKGSGWDWVVITQPAKEREASGSFNGITPDFSFKLEPNDNSLKDRRGTATFPALPEGDYEARYISWAGAGSWAGVGTVRAGSNEITARASFKVGNAPPPPPGDRNPPPFKVKDLTGLWRNPGGTGIYRVRQIGSKLVWGLDAVAMGSFANMFQGQISGDTIDGVWEDLPGSPTIGGGRMLLKIESECRFVRVSSVNRYGADIWVKKDSLCDVTGLTQRSNASGIANAGNKAANNAIRPVPTVEDIPADKSPKVATNKPATAPRRKPPVVEEIPETAGTNVAPERPRANSPRVEEIPEDSVAATNTGGGTRRGANRQPPVVEEIPEEAAANRPPSGGNSQPSTDAGRPPSQTAKKEKKEKKPKDPNKPDIWTRLGRAVREGITQQPTQPTDTQQPTQPAQQPDGQCRGGSYWLGTPTPNSWRLGTPGAGVQIPWSTPLGVTGAKILIFYAGTNNQLTDSALPENANACGLSYSFYPNAAGYFDAYLFQGTTPVAGPVRFVVTQ
jgi:hypothetical protein